MLVLTPKNAYDKGVWKSEVSDHTTAKVIDLETVYQRAGLNKDKIKKIMEVYHIIVCKHSHVRNLGSLISIICSLGRTVVVWDELHKLKNPKSSLTVLNRVACNQAYARWSLTATPLSRNLEDCYNLVNFINPWYLGTFDSFKKEYCTKRDVVISDIVTGKQIGRAHV